jgi:hypothetical protein
MPKTWKNFRLNVLELFRCIYCKDDITIFGSARQSVEDEFILWGITDATYDIRSHSENGRWHQARIPSTYYFLTQERLGKQKSGGFCLRRYTDPSLFQPQPGQASFNFTSLDTTCSQKLLNVCSILVPFSPYLLTSLLLFQIRMKKYPKIPLNMCVVLETNSIF